MVARFNLVLLSMIIVVCEWQVGCVNKQGVHWSLLYQRAQALQMGLIQNQNLNKYVNFSVYSAIDNQSVFTDQTKVKWSYNTEQCINDLRTIQETFNDKTTHWANESKQIQLLEMLKIIFEILNTFLNPLRFTVFGSWGKVPPVGFARDYGNFDQCHELKVNKSINIETQYCLGCIIAVNSSLNNM